METPDVSLPPRWADAATTIKDLIDGGESMLLAKTLPEGASSHVGMERYAREYCRVHEQADLAMIYAILGVSTAIAAQGGYVLSTPLPGGEWLEVPAIQMVLGVAPSGSGKSTSLKVATKILDRVLAAALSDRRRRLPGMKNASMLAFEREHDGENIAPDAKQFQEVFDAGLCPKTMVGDPTQEALRNWAVNNGGHVGVISGEADIFKSASAYTADGSANYSILLNAWDQGKIDTARVSNSDLQIDKASIPLCVLFQTEVFAEVTSGNSRGMSGSGDTFVAKGMFARMFVVETDQIEDYSKIAQLYTDENDFDNDHNDPDGYRDADGNPTELGFAAIDFELALRDIATDSNQYRIDKAVHRSWHIAATKYGTEMMVPEVPEPERTVILLDAPGRLAYRRLQRMMADIQQHVQDQQDEDLKTLWMPMAARITQHVLREALIVTLAAGRTNNQPFKVTAQTIEDAACRILPWRWCYSANALTRRANERAEDLVAASMLQLNPQQKDLTAPSMIRDLLKTLATEDKSLTNPGIPLAKLTEKVRSRLPRERRSQVSTLLKTTLPVLCSDPASGITEHEGKPGIGGKIPKTYRIAVSAQVF
jgi:hypothetical protein